MLAPARLRHSPEVAARPDPYLLRKENASRGEGHAVIGSRFRYVDQRLAGMRDDLRRHGQPLRMNTPGHGVFGVASIDAAGTIRLRVVSQHSESPQPCGAVCYERSHPGYAAVLEQIGPLAVGEEKVILPEKVA